MGKKRRRIKVNKVFDKQNKLGGCPFGGTPWRTTLKAQRTPRISPLRAPLRKPLEGIPKGHSGELPLENTLDDVLQDTQYSTPTEDTLSGALRTPWRTPLEDTVDDASGRHPGRYPKRIPLEETTGGHPYQGAPQKFPTGVLPGPGVRQEDIYTIIFIYIILNFLGELPE
jgi:hypothetical protein